MKKLIILFLILASQIVFPQGKNPHFNSTVLYLMVYDHIFSATDFYTLIDPAKIKAAKIKKIEAIQSWDFTTDPSLPDAGFEGIGRRDIFEFDKNGNPVKYLQYSFSFEGYLTEYQIEYDKAGFISAVTATGKDTTGKNIFYTEKYTFNFTDGKLTSISGKDPNDEAGRWGTGSYNFIYRPDGSLEKITAGSAGKELIYCDEKGRILQLKVFSQVYTYYYDKNGRVAKINYVESYNGDNWDWVYSYDAKGSLLSVKSTDEYTMEQKTYTPGKDGFPLKAKLKYETKSSGRAVNYEFRYTK